MEKWLIYHGRQANQTSENALYNASDFNTHLYPFINNVHQVGIFFILELSNIQLLLQYEIEQFYGR